jgi:hypothetical protein
VHLLVSQLLPLRSVLLAIIVLLVPPLVPVLLVALEITVLVVLQRRHRVHWVHFAAARRPLPRLHARLVPIVVLSVWLLLVDSVLLATIALPELLLL